MNDGVLLLRFKSGFAGRRYRNITDPKSLSHCLVGKSSWPSAQYTVSWFETALELRSRCLLTMSGREDDALSRKQKRRRDERRRSGLRFKSGLGCACRAPLNYVVKFTWCAARAPYILYTLWPFFCFLRLIALYLKAAYKMKIYRVSGCFHNTVRSAHLIFLGYVFNAPYLGFVLVCEIKSGFAGRRCRNITEPKSLSYCLVGKS
jgi:hypothetical protein